LLISMVTALGMDLSFKITEFLTTRNSIAKVMRHTVISPL
jgi:hypothetical protein